MRIMKRKTQANGIIAIDKGIPFPEGRGHKKYPFREMKVGDSVFVPNMTTRASFNGALQSAAPFRFTSKTMVENGVIGCRVWRTE